MTIGRDIIGNLAKQFGYSKELVRDALASNQIDPLTASLIGSRIDKMQQIKQQAASQTTVMEDVLAPKPEEVMQSKGIAAAPQQAPSALAALPSNLPTEGMAGGGIVAFAEGDLIEDDEDEPKEKSTLSQLMGGLSSGLASLRGAIPQNVSIPMPKSYEAALAEKGQTPASARKLMIEGPKKGDYVMPPLDSQRPSAGGKGHKYEAAVVKEAERLGVDPNLALHVLYKETGNLKNPETARSKAGAVGVMQLMPRTAKELGVDPLNPEENIRGGVTYLKKMLDQFNDPTLALAAYNAGPGRVNQVLRSGQGIEALPRETRNYIRMADGGIVAFQNRGLVEPKGLEDLTPEEIEQMSKPFIGQRVFRPSRLQELQQQALGAAHQRQGEQEEKAALPTPVIRTSFEPEPSPTTAPTVASAPTPEVDIKKLVGGDQGGEKEDSIMKKYLSLLEGREKASTEQRKTDAYLSLLSAGLGIMGGTSPFAATNIGQGAQAGVATQMGARRAQAAEEAATLKGFGTAAAAEEYAKQRQLLVTQGQEAKIGNLIANREKQIETVAYNNLVKGNINFAMLEPAQQQAAIAGETQRLKSADPLLTKLYQQYGLPPIQAAAPAKPLTKDELLAQRKAEKDRLGIK